MRAIRTVKRCACEREAAGRALRLADPARKPPAARSTARAHGRSFRLNWRGRQSESGTRRPGRHLHERRAPCRRTRCSFNFRIALHPSTSPAPRAQPQTHKRRHGFYQGGGGFQEAACGAQEGAAGLLGARGPAGPRRWATCRASASSASPARRRSSTASRRPRGPARMTYQRCERRRRAREGCETRTRSRLL